MKLEDFLIKANKIHGSTFDYSKVFYKNNKTKIEIICKNHGSFFQSPNSHLGGHGCPSCYYETKFNSQEYFVNKCKEIHHNKYDYSKVKYSGIYKNIIIICFIHGEFEQTARNHLSGSGCQACWTDKNRLDKEHFLKRAKDVHGDRYDYSKVDYIKYNKEVCIICKIHGEFLQKPIVHYGGSGCSKCSHIVSILEDEWLNSISNSIVRQKFIKIGNKSFIVDGYDPITNTIYEFYGDFWHGNPSVYPSDGWNHITKKSFGELYQLTIQKENILKQANFNLITIWEKDFLSQNYKLIV